MTETITTVIFHHSRRVFLFGSLQARRLNIEPDPELLYVAALFHDTGLVERYRGIVQRSSRCRVRTAFTDGFKDRPQTTFGTVNADVLEHFVPGFHRIDFVDVINNSAWQE